MASICCSPPESVPATCFWRSLRRGKSWNTRAMRAFDLARGARIAAHFQVLAHAHLLEHAPPLRAERHAQGNDLAGRHAGNVLALEE